MYLKFVSVCSIKNFGIYGHTVSKQTYTHTSCNAVLLVWGLLRLAPIIGATSGKTLYREGKMAITLHMRGCWVVQHKLGRGIYLSILLLMPMHRCYPQAETIEQCKLQHMYPPANRDLWKVYATNIFCMDNTRDLRSLFTTTFSLQICIKTVGVALVSFVAYIMLLAFFHILPYAILCI